jgi:hypothetical protein
MSWLWKRKMIKDTDTQTAMLSHNPHKHKLGVYTNRQQIDSIVVLFFKIRRVCRKTEYPNKKDNIKGDDNVFY